MQLEPGVSEYTVRSKERICHCFSKVTADPSPEIIYIITGNVNIKHTEERLETTLSRLLPGREARGSHPGVFGGPAGGA